MRPSKEATMMEIAVAMSKRATCKKLAVGCVLVDAKGRILSTGYNGVPAHLLHCIDQPCVGADQAAGSDSCQAVHAEINAILQCKDVDKIDTCYVTTMPCNYCMKTLLNTSCRRIVTLEGAEPAAATFWRKSGRTIDKVTFL